MLSTIFGRGLLLRAAAEDCSTKPKRWDEYRRGRQKFRMVETLSTRIFFKQTCYNSTILDELFLTNSIHDGNYISRSRSARIEKKPARSAYALQNFLLMMFVSGRMSAGNVHINHSEE